MSQNVTLNLPESVYKRIQQRAEQTQRTVEDELLEMVNTILPGEETLSGDLANAIAALALLDDKTLWQAARTHLPVKSIARMERLHDKRRDQNLTDAEKQELTELLEQYEKSILFRSEAMGILMERGHDVTILAASRDYSGK